MTQPIVNGDSAAASARRHSGLVLVATQILGRVLLHNGVGVPPEIVGIGAELLIDGVSVVLSGAAGGIGWLLHRKRNS